MTTNRYAPEEHSATTALAAYVALDAARADIERLCNALADVRYTQTVGEMQRIARLQREVRARWIAKAVRP